MDNAMYKKLKRKPKWKLNQERNELQEIQKVLRMETRELEDNLDKLKNDEIAAFKANDTVSIPVIEAQIEMIEKTISEKDKRYKMNADILEVYSKVSKNDKEGDSASVGTAIGAVTGLGGLALAFIGLKKAYNSDMEGTLINKKTLDWVQRLPIIRNFGRK